MNRFNQSTKTRILGVKQFGGVRNINILVIENGDLKDHQS